MPCSGSGSWSGHGPLQDDEAGVATTTSNLIAKILLEGRPGVGKTSLMRRLWAQLERRQVPLGGFITAMGKGATNVLPAPTDGLRCPECGSTLKDFRETGRLGCAQCYLAFDGHLRDLLRRLHGSSQHVGERYAAPGETDTDPRVRLLELKEQLRRAVESENFELAAELRDRIRVLE